MTDAPVTLMTFNKEEDAELKQMLLAQEGIKSFLNNANVATLNLGSALGEIKLQVAAADAARARAILDLAPHSEDDSPRTDNQCLACGATMPEDSSICPKCGWSYKTGANAS